MGLNKLDEAVLNAILRSVSNGDAKPLKVQLERATGRSRRRIWVIIGPYSVKPTEHAFRPNNAK